MPAGPPRVTGFLGPDGAAKSTTMRQLLGLEKPDSGQSVSATMVGPAARPSSRGRPPSTPSSGQYVSGAVPAGALAMLGSGHGSVSVYTPAEGFLILLAWAVVLLTVAGLALKKRNV